MYKISITVIVILDSNNQSEMHHARNIYLYLDHYHLLSLGQSESNVLN